MSKKRKTILGIVALFLVIAVGVIAVQRFKYSAQSQLLVVQEHSGLVDAYTASKSSEHLSSVLASVVGSNSFFTKVTTTSPSINTAYFGTNRKDQVKEWRHTVKAQSINDSGIIAVTVYHPDRSEAEKIAGAVNYVLMTEHSAYDGAGEAVKVRLIDQPVTSSFPVKPNVPLIITTSLVLGFFFSLMYIYVVSVPSASSVVRHDLLSNFEEVKNPLERSRENFVNQPRNYQESSQYSEADYVNQARHKVVEQRDHLRNTSPHSPYGQRARVNIHERVIPELDTYYSEKPPATEEIFEQGQMRNILG